MAWGHCLRLPADLQQAVGLEGGRRAARTIEFRQGIEPLAWALYDPVQLCQEVLRTTTRAARYGDTSIRGRIDELEAQIQRGDDGSALPGQDRQLAALHTFMTVEVPQILNAIDPSRLLSRILADRAAPAAELIRSEFERQVGRRGGLDRSFVSQRSVPEANADKAYSFLMGESDRFAGIPRPAELVECDMDLPISQIVAQESITTLADASEQLVFAADQAADGRWPPEAAGQWKRPAKRTWTIAGVLAGAGLIAAGILIDWDHSDTLIAMGSVLLPGTLGRLVKEGSALRAPAAQP